MTIINAFHPDYVKTYHPELLTSIKTESAQVENGRINGAKSKGHRQSANHTEKKTLSSFPTTKPKKAKVKRVSLERTPIFTYSKAGTK